MLKIRVYIRLAKFCLWMDEHRMCGMFCRAALEESLGHRLVGCREYEPVLKKLRDAGLISGAKRKAFQKAYSHTSGALHGDIVRTEDLRLSIRIAKWFALRAERNLTYVLCNHGAPTSVGVIVTVPKGQVVL